MLCKRVDQQRGALQIQRNANVELGRSCLSCTNASCWGTYLTPPCSTNVRCTQMTTHLSSSLAQRCSPPANMSFHDSAQ
jgi:hypothetical protein